MWIHPCHKLQISRGFALQVELPMYYHNLSKWPWPMFVPLDRCLLFLLDITYAFPVVFRVRGLTSPSPPSCLLRPSSLLPFIGSLHNVTFAFSKIFGVLSLSSACYFSIQAHSFLIGLCGLHSSAVPSIQSISLNVFCPLLSHDAGLCFPGFWDLGDVWPPTT